MLPHIGQAMIRLRFAVLKDDREFDDSVDTVYESYFPNSDEMWDWLRDQQSHPFLYIHVVSHDEVEDNTSLV